MEYRVDIFDGKGGHEYAFFETEKAARFFEKTIKDGYMVFILKKGNNAVFAYDVIYTR